MAQSLWDRWTKGKEAVELIYANPLKVKIGTHFDIDILGYRGAMFTLQSIIEYKRRFEKEMQCNFTDYEMSTYRESNGIRLRFMPKTDTEFSILLLEQYDEFPYSKELDDCLHSGNNDLTITDNDSGQQETYWRINKMLTTPYKATQSIISDQNHDGKIEDTEVEKCEIEYWDFARQTQDEAKLDFTQFLFVELDLDSKVQTMWRGIEIDSQAVTIL